MSIHRRETNLTDFSHKRVCDLGPRILCNIMKSTISRPRATRQSSVNSLKITCVKTTACEKSISHRFSKRWFQAKPRPKSVTLNEWKRLMRTVWGAFDYLMMFNIRHQDIFILVNRINLISQSITKEWPVCMVDQLLKVYTTKWNDCSSACITPSNIIISKKGSSSAGSVCQLKRNNFINNGAR